MPALVTALGWAVCASGISAVYYTKRRSENGSGLIQIKHNA